MPTARELLEQADALMRRNRMRSQVDEIPVLTDVADSAMLRVESAAPMRAVPAPGHPVASGVDRPAASQARPASLDDIPVLNDVVEEIEAVSLLDEIEGPDEMTQWMKVDRGEVSITGPMPDSIVVVPPAIKPAVAETAALPPETVAAPIAPPVEEETGFEIEALESVLSDVEPNQVMVDATVTPMPVTTAATLVAAIDAAPVMGESAPIAEEPAPIADDSARWEMLAEDVRMQVLQRLDIFTDTGLREQLTARLQPIVDRASAELVKTINEDIGQLLRTYVAEAIEREIEKWRKGDA